MNVLQSTYDELKAECDALAIKAGRYDWLRISADISWNGWVTHSMLAATDAERAELDSAIDSAMASSGYEVNTRHGAGDADHSPDAGKMADDRSAELTTAWMAGVERERDRAAEDSARLDYIERTFSGMTNRERYLPVTMIWGKGANGRTLREACDKYMAKDAARAGERG